MGHNLSLGMLEKVKKLSFFFFHLFLLVGGETVFFTFMEAGKK